MAKLGYCTIESVAARTGLTVSGDTQPSAGEVSSIIERKAGEINGTLKALGYTMPVTDPSDLNFLAGLNELGAACDVWYASVQGTSAYPAAEYWCRTFSEMLDALRTGKLTLPNTTPGLGVRTSLSVFKV